jgi:hypothetical protein
MRDRQNLVQKSREIAELVCRVRRIFGSLHGLCIAPDAVN